MDFKIKGIVLIAAIIFLISTIFFFIAKPAFALKDNLINEKTLGEMCINQTIPTAKVEEKNTDLKGDEDENGAIEESTKGQKDDRKKNKKLAGLGDEPMVIIYHTHSSESYRPYTGSNYHREAEEGTVRDVGNILEKELESKGINVIHDKTIHDRPSYNESYERSLSTINELTKEYPSAVYIIDLHRDAAPSSAKEGKSLTIDNQKVAKFSMVVGQANDNYSKLYAFAKKVSSKAEELYPGFGGEIIQQNYFYNEFVSDKAILLEVGDNKNTIEEARACGEYFADVLSEIIEEEQ